MNEQPDNNNDSNTLDIAIVGMSGRFPGANNLDEFWQNLCNGVESISFFSDEELKASGVTQAEFEHPNYVRAGPVLNNIDLFDANFFGYSPLEAKAMDPQQRFLLEGVWEALEQAGYAPAKYPEPIGVFVGTRMSSYMVGLYANREFSQPQNQLLMLLGNDISSLSTRVSYKLNLQGPSYALHTGCSTSLVAVHVACQSLLMGECRMAVAGGVTINVPHKIGYQYEAGSMMSPDGHCRSFDAQAGGTVFGSGMGVVVLKRLEDAIAEGDTIYAVIKGSATNNDGSFKASFTAPSVEGQSAVIIDALATSGIDPETISYLEAHATATPLGDPIEVRATTNAYRASTRKKGFCRIGTVKSNLGHLDVAAGMAGLLKTTLALKHRLIPPTLNFEHPNPEIDFENSPFIINTELTKWETTKGQPRRAGVNSFGFGGTNAHVILEEAPAVEPSGPARPWQLLLLSARTSTALDKATQNLAGWFGQAQDVSLADVAYTLQVGRQDFGQRRMLVCQTAADAASALETMDPQRILTNERESGERPVVWMFTGQGTQYVNMGLELYQTEPRFRAEVDRCSQLLQPLLGLDLRQMIYPAAGSEAAASLQLEQTGLTQPALFVIEYALAQLWLSWGVKPQAMIGHSIGEYVAACLAGVFTLEDGLKLVAARGRLMQSLPGGAMLSVPLPEGEIRPLLTDQLDLAAVNGPKLSVVSGPSEAIEQLEARLLAQGITCQRLHTSHAFHSAMMDPIIAPFTAAIKQIRLQAPTLPLISNVSGTWITDEQATSPDYWAQHLRQPVRFADGVREATRESSSKILLEVGPGRTLTTLARQALPQETTALILNSMRHPQDQQSDLAFLLTNLGKLWLAGLKIDWAGFSAHEHRYRVALPTYPFERQRYWAQADTSAPGKMYQDPAAKKPNIGDWFYVPVWKQSVLAAPPVSSDLTTQKSCWLVFKDECGLGSQLETRLKQEGHEVITVSVGPQFAKLEEYAYSIDPQQGKDYSNLLEALHQSNQDPQAIVHLWQVMPQEQIISRIDFAEKCQSLGFYSLIFLAQALAVQETNNNVRIHAISNNMHEVLEEGLSYPEKATVLGPCRVISQEYPQLACRSIDIDSSAPGALQQERLLNQLVTELSGQSSDPIVAYRGAHRWVQTLDEIRLNETHPTDIGSVRKGGVYLITGGLGGLGLVMAEYLAKTAQAKLVLTNRSAFPKKDDWEAWLAAHNQQDQTSIKIKALQALEGLGAEIMVAQADVTNMEQMRAAVDEASRRFGGIHGVIHMAGVAGGGMIQLKTPEIAATVMAPKVRGTLILDELFKDVDLEFFVLFSSLTAIVGEFGQVDYCAANAFLDAFAHQSARQHHRPTVSINWPTWRDAGMAVTTEVPAALQEWHEEQLKVGISSREGTEAFHRILTSGVFSQIAISTSDLHRVIEQIAALTQEQLKIMAQMQLPTESHPRPELQTTYVAPRNEIEQAVAEMWQRILGVETIGIYDSFFDLGGHSLLITQVVNDIRRTFKVELPLRSMFEQATVAAIAQLIENSSDQLAEADEKPIAERIQVAFPTERIGLLETYLRKKISLALNAGKNQLPADGSLAEVDLESISVDLMLSLKQDFQIQVFPQEIPRIPSLNAFARFVQVELDRRADLTQLATDHPLSFYTLQPYRRRISKQTSLVGPGLQKNGPMAFIHSSPRSGSTLLRVMLAGHPNLFCPPELHLLYFDAMKEWQENLGFGDELAWTGKGLEWAFVELMSIEADKSQEYIQKLVGQDEPVFNVYKHLQDGAQGRLLIDKTPTYSLDPETLERAEKMFESPKYVHLVRHPYAVIDSFLRIRLDKLFGPNIFKESDVDPYVIAETVWATANRNLLEFLETVDPARHYLVRYEDMVSDPTTVMTELCHFLGVPFDEAVLNPYDGRHERMTGGLGDPNIFQHKQIDPALGEAWKKVRLPRLLDQSTVEIATKLGYTLPQEAEARAAGDTSEADMLANLDNLSSEEVAAMLQSLLAEQSNSDE